MTIAAVATAADLDPTSVDAEEEMRFLMLCLVLHVVMAWLPVCLLFAVWLGGAYRNLLALGFASRVISRPARFAFS